jgi:hypothetical protein
MEENNNIKFYSFYKNPHPTLTAHNLDIYP